MLEYSHHATQDRGSLVLRADAEEDGVILQIALLKQKSLWA